ncbi:MAG: hypothetical protein COU42_01100 [Candidatus Nealsonbacteria bacterium CG10_big_fil_rev_8_21_14_0_10_36_24]|uniref:EF-hand domain-containing protein n=2 Tax=Candidatus Nealsoniibacteriota TaxID=1817911 RepID=A0A2H0YP03_9BACT|nr:MAG: hypothetical protein COU42_01100 [Candidatus Nealsonbacteria bacterium CG10_big_fil_rev_8_21_14_0_10_36_24]PIS40156.1 MAG: hypothetical protein COT32_01255 [Candidatus Nealsonbacteria bacterium CG08_land_8_20_14_0_20_36_22]
MKIWGKNILRNLVVALFCCFLLFVKGCHDTQSNQAIFVNDATARLYFNEGQNPKFLDRWAVSKDTEGRDICGLFYGVVIQLIDENGDEFHQAGIRVDTQVDDHFSIAGFGDIWEKEASNGKPYGTIKVFPEEGSGVSHGVIYARTNGNGRVGVFWGLGDPEGSFDPEAPLDFSYKLPGPGGSSSDVFDTLVQLKITIPRPHSPLNPIYVWGAFNRMQYQNMWLPVNGVYGNSFSGLGRYTLTFGISETNGMKLPIKTSLKLLDEFKTKAPKSKASDYPLTNMDTTSGGPSLDRAQWYQLRWSPDYGWYWDDPYRMHALWTVDANDPNDMKDAMTTCEPYVLWTEVTLPEPFDGNEVYSTVILRSLVNGSNVVSKIPMHMHLDSKSSDNMTLKMFSDYVVVVECPEDQGYYLDKWQNSYVAIYAPQGSILDADFPEKFGDFNADDRVDSQDLRLFSEHWLGSADILYEEPNNWDGRIDFKEFSAFAENWLK